jgi:hypothetical protein
VPNDEESDIELPSDEDNAAADATSTIHLIEDDSDVEQHPPPNKRLRQRKTVVEDDQDDNKKKMAMDVSYEGFALYGRVLCLVVKKRESQSSASNAARASVAEPGQNKPRGQAVMENWITSTQMPAAEEDGL